MKKQTTKLLASAPSLNNCKKLIEKYWCSNSIVLLKTGSLTWRAWNNDVEMLEFRVLQKGNRFRFEALLNQEES